MGPAADLSAREVLRLFQFNVESQLASGELSFRLQDKADETFWRSFESDQHDDEGTQAAKEIRSLFTSADVTGLAIMIPADREAFSGSVLLVGRLASGRGGCCRFRDRTRVQPPRVGMMRLVLAAAVLSVSAVVAGCEGEIVPLAPTSGSALSAGQCRFEPGEDPCGRTFDVPPEQLAAFVSAAAASTTFAGDARELALSVRAICEDPALSRGWSRARQPRRARPS